MGYEPHLDANLLAAWLEGGLADRQHRQLLRHLSECDACRSWAACAQTAGAALLAGEQITPASAPVRALAARRALGRWQAPLGLAASAALVAAVVWRLPRTRAVPPPAPHAAVSHLLPSAAATARGPRLHPQVQAPMPRPHSFGGTVPAPATALLPLPVVSAPGPAPAPAPAIGAAVQPHIDFSPLLTGFQDQPELPMARSALAAWDGEVNPTGGATATPALAVSTPAAGPAGAPLWPFASGFAASAGSSDGPLAPSVASGLGWAISRGGEVLRSIGAGLWQAVPLVPGVHFRALAEIGDSVWAGGRADQLFFSPDHGAHWRAVRLPRLGAHPAPLQSISFYDAHHGTVMSRDGRVWITSDGGTTWTAE